MFSKVLKKKYLKQVVAYFSLLCMCLSSLPTKVFSEDFCCENSGCAVLVNQEDAQRTKTATIVAGATIIGLVAGVAYMAFGADHHKHHHHSSYSSSSYYTNFDPIFDYSSSSSKSDSYRYSDHSHGYSEYSPSDYYSYNPYSIFSENNVSSFSGGSDYSELTDPQIFERRDSEGNRPARGRQLARSKGSKGSKNSKESSQLSGLLTSHPTLSPSGQGSFTAFVQLPDGTTQVLGHLSFSGNGGTSLPWGPFNHKGTYAFGISLDEGTPVATQTKIASIEIHIDGSTVQSGEFLIPSHAPAHYEPTPLYFDY